MERKVRTGVRERKGGCESVVGRKEEREGRGGREGRERREGR